MKVAYGKESTKSIVGEMTSGVGGQIAEMISDPAKLMDLVPVAGITERAAALVAANNDEKPEFPVLRVEEGWSGSGNLWPAREIDSIVAQVNALEPVGHLGHIPDDQAAFAFPPPQTTWIGAYAKTEPSQQKGRVGEMVRVAYFAGYNYPDADVRKHIRNKAVRGISWWGNADKVPIPGKGYEIKNFTLKALDWARKLAEGMPSTQIVAIASEMEDKMDGKELALVTPAEFKEHNPNGYQLLVSEATAEAKTVIGEMEKKVEDAEDAKSLLVKACEAVGVKDAGELLTAIATLTEKVGAKASSMVKTALDSLLEEKVPDEEKRAIVRRLLPVGEMESKVADAKDEEDAKKIIGEMVDATFDKDTVIKGLVSEMQPPVVRRREELTRGGASLDNNEYVTRERVTLGS